MLGGWESVCQQGLGVLEPGFPSHVWQHVAGPVAQWVYVGRAGGWKAAPRQVSR